MQIAPLQQAMATTLGFLYVNWAILCCSMPRHGVRPSVWSCTTSSSSWPRCRCSWRRLRRTTPTLITSAARPRSSCMPSRTRTLRRSSSLPRRGSRCASALHAALQLVEQVSVQPVGNMLLGQPGPALPLHPALPCAALPCAALPCTPPCPVLHCLCHTCPAIGLSLSCYVSCPALSSPVMHSAKPSPALSCLPCRLHASLLAPMHSCLKG